MLSAMLWQLRSFLWISFLSSAFAGAVFHLLLLWTTMLLFFLCVSCQHLLRLLLSLSQILFGCCVRFLCLLVKDIIFCRQNYTMHFHTVSVSFFRNQQWIFKRLIHRNPKITNPKNTESHWVCSSRHTFFPPRWPNKVALLQGRPTGSCGYWICEG